MNRQADPPAGSWRSAPLPANGKIARAEAPRLARWQYDDLGQNLVPGQNSDPCHVLYHVLHMYNQYQLHRAESRLTFLKLGEISRG
jgi:hypothetical protein